MRWCRCLKGGTVNTDHLPETLAGIRCEAEGPGTVEMAPAGAGQRMLVVEDNVEVGRFATQILEDLGYETEWAPNAEEALDKLGANGSGFDVVMPGMGGIALAQELRRRLPGLPVVLASG